jgi:uncharacterized protein YyaL (SSP411 family)
MLYDNAQLARAYTHAWQVTHDPLFRRVAIETLDYVTRELRDPAGGFYSSQDADSEGVEGKFFVWDSAEIREVLGENAQLFMEAYGVSDRGNFEGHNILHVPAEANSLAERHGLSVDDIDSKLSESRRLLFERRAARVHPSTDDKVIASWNGMVLAAFADAARVFDRDDYRQIAKENAEFVLDTMRTPAGRLSRTWRRGHTKLNGYLEDYACYVDGLLSLYEATFDERWFVAGLELAEVMLGRFAHPAGGFYDTSDDHESLVVRPRDMQDNATPSGNAMAALVLLRLGAFTGSARYHEAADAALRLIQPMAGNYPTAFAQWLCAIDFALSKPKEIAVVGDPSHPDTRALLDVIVKPYRPNQVVAVRAAGDGSAVPLLEGRTQLDGRATAYVCENFSCRLPVTESDALASLLAS